MRSGAYCCPVTWDSGKRAVFWSSLDVPLSMGWVVWRLKGCPVPHVPTGCTPFVNWVFQTALFPAQRILNLLQRPESFHYCLILFPWAASRGLEFISLGLGVGQRMAIFVEGIRCVGFLVYLHRVCPWAVEAQNKQEGKVWAVGCGPACLPVLPTAEWTLRSNSTCIPTLWVVLKVYWSRKEDRTESSSLLAQLINFQILSHMPP